MKDLLISHWNGFNRSSGLQYDREPGTAPLAKKHEISWNGYPLPIGLRITDLDFSTTPMANGQLNWDLVDVDRSLRYPQKKVNHDHQA
jgi:hypothetical protein